MQKVYTLPGGVILAGSQPFVLNDISYPANWLERATPEELTERGITVEEPDIQLVLFERLAALRYAAEEAGVMHGNVLMPTDRIRRSALKDAADKMRDGHLNEPIAIAFSVTAYAMVTLQQLDEAIETITTYVQKVYSDALTVAVGISGGTITTIQQLDDAWAAVRAIT